MSHFKGHFEGAKTFLKIMSRSFLNSGTLIVIMPPVRDNEFGYWLDPSVQYWNNRSHVDGTVDEAQRPNFWT